MQIIIVKFASIKKLGIKSLILTLINNIYDRLLFLLIFTYWPVCLFIHVFKNK